MEDNDDDYESFDEEEKEEIEEETIENENDFTEKYFIVSKNKRLTPPSLTRNEYLNLLISRIKELENGSKPLVEGKNYKDIAEIEIKQKLINPIVKRIYDYDIEIWELKELNIQKNY